MLKHVLLTQSGGAGGRGGARSYDPLKTSYCADNAHSGRHNGEYCRGVSTGYVGCCNEGGSPGDSYDNDDDVSSLMYLPGSGGGAGAGSGGGAAGGNGGASILLYSTEMTLNGAVKANGGVGGESVPSPGGGGGGGGSGGALSITACTVTTGLSASLQAKGGDGGAGAGSSQAYSK